MIELLNSILKLPFLAISFIVGSVFVVLSNITYDKDHITSTNLPNSWPLFAFGSILILASLILFSFSQLMEHRRKRPGDPSAAPLHLSSTMNATENQSSRISTKILECEIYIEFGRIEKYHHNDDTVFVLPCNEYFDHACVTDPNGALGAYVNRAFPGRAEEFSAAVELHAARTLGPAKTQQKTISVMAPSFGAGRALLLENALNTGRTIAVVSTATQRVGEGLVGRLSYIFGGVRELATSLAETKLKEVVMPLLGAGHAGLSSSLALIGLLVAVAEVVRYGPGSSKLRRVTIVVFQKDEHATPAVSRAEIHHALALISQKG